MSAPDQAYSDARCVDLARLLDLHFKYLQAATQASETQAYIDAQGESHWPFRGQGPESVKQRLKEQTKKAEALRDEFLAARDAFMSRLRAIASINPTTQENTVNEVIIPTAEEILAIAEAATTQKVCEEVEHAVTEIRCAAKDGRMSLVIGPTSQRAATMLEERGYRVTRSDQNTKISWEKE